MSIIDLHPSGQFITIRGKYRSTVIPVNPLVIKAYEADQKLRDAHSWWVHGIEFLPMPVHESPILCLLFKKEWIPRYTNSLKVISLMLSIINCYSTIINMDKAQTVMRNQTAEMEDAMFKRVEASNRIDPLEFIHIMEEATIRRIHILEQCIHDAFLPTNLPLEACLTPKELPSLPADRYAEWNKVMVHYFEHKQHVRNMRLEKALPESAPAHEFKHYFNLDAMRERVPTYRGFIDKETAQEYLNFMLYS